MRIITKVNLSEYQRYLIEEERSLDTIKKYMRDITAIVKWLAEQALDKQAVLEYKAFLVAHYAPASVNSMLSSLNHFFHFKEWFELKVRMIKMQKPAFISDDRELKKAEYERLLTTAKEKKNERLYLLMQTVCSTGIRVSELCHITVEAIKNRRAEIRCKGKLRIVFLPTQLCVALRKYIKQQNIKNGPVFITKNGKPLDRSNIWSEMKKLCKSTGVSEKKVFPHNLRHLFARTYYSIQKDIVRLADILGHSNVNTTRIYTMESGEVHRKQIQKLGLLRC